MIEIREPKKEEFDSYYNFRWELLRKPWSQPKGSEKDDFEDTAYHLVAIDKNKIIGIGRLHKNSDEEGQIRFMVVDENFRNEGIGKAILDKLHEKAKKLNLKKIILNARKDAVKFYERQGYKKIAQAHTLFGEIEHFKMEYNFN